MLDQILLQLDREGIKERENGEMGGGGGGRLLEEGDYFKYFLQRGAIIREKRLMGRLLFEKIRYSSKTLHELSNIFVVHAWHVARIQFRTQA